MVVLLMELPLSQIFENDKLTDQTLGTPSSQIILRLLAVWENLSAKDIVIKSELSESQVFTTLNRLLSINVIEKVQKGIYQFDAGKFPQFLKQAYTERSINRINKIIYEITGHLRNDELNQAEEKYKDLMLFYEPLLKRNFSHLLSSISHSFLDAFEARK